MKAYIIAYSISGGEIAYRLVQGLNKAGYDATGYLYEKYSSKALVSFQSAENIVAQAFSEKSLLIFVCAMGIAVRKIAPFIESKYTDSAVVVIDDAGRYAIPVLSGHMGGANDMAWLCGKIIDAKPVITTATDIHHKFAVDNFAKENQLYLSDGRIAKEISAALLHGETTGLYVDRSCCNVIMEDEEKLKNQGIVNVVSVEDSPYTYNIAVTPFEGNRENTEYLVPRQITIGVGCRKGVSCTEVETAVNTVMKEYKIACQAVKQICSIDIKAREEGLIEFCKEKEIPFYTFSAQELLSVEGSKASSEFVKEITGVDNVCERSALAGSKGRLIVPKQVVGRVTVAVAIEKADVRIV